MMLFMQKTTTLTAVIYLHNTLAYITRMKNRQIIT